MKLLGKANWYLPKWLERLPDISVGEGATIGRAPETAKPAIPIGGAVLKPVPVIAEDIGAPRKGYRKAEENNGPGSRTV